MRAFICLLVFGAILVGCPAKKQKEGQEQQVLQKQSFEGLIGAKVASEDAIKFDREKLTTFPLEEEARLKKLFKKKTNLVEGYWRWKPEETPEGQGYPWPIAHESKFPGKEEFLMKLNVVENLDKDLTGTTVFLKNGTILKREETLGYDHCRLGDLEINGGGDFYLIFDSHTIVWPTGYRHYIVVHNLIPSREFYRLIMNLDATVEKVEKKERWPPPNETLTPSR